MLFIIKFHTLKKFHALDNEDALPIKNKNLMLLIKNGMLLQIKMPLCIHCKCHGFYKNDMVPTKKCHATYKKIEHGKFRKIIL